MLTDTGRLAELLDAASLRWPDVPDRKQLLLRLAEEGHQALVETERRMQANGQRDRIREAMQRIPSLVEEDILLGDRAWT